MPEPPIDRAGVELLEGFAVVRFGDFWEEANGAERERRRLALESAEACLMDLGYRASVWRRAAGRGGAQLAGAMADGLRDAVLRG